jgi:hypothetical protein
MSKKKPNEARQVERVVSWRDGVAIVSAMRKQIKLLQWFHSHTTGIYEACDGANKKHLQDMAEMFNSQLRAINSTIPKEFR